MELYSDSDANLVDLGGVSATASAANAGGGQGHENRQPLLGINFIIALNGTFPPRN